MTRAEILHRMIGLCVDSAKRYRHAAADVSRDDLERFFKHEAEARQKAADELQAERIRLGYDEAEAGTMGGLLDRIELDLSVAMSKGDSGVVEWCREDAAELAAEYETALAGRLPAQLRRILERQLAAVRNTIAEMDRVLKLYGGPRS